MALTLVFQRLLSLAVIPWDSLGCVCNQSYTIKEKASGGAVISYERTGKYWFVAKK